MKEPFDEHAEEYDTWFLKNENVLESEVRLLKRFLENPGKALSVGCGSGLFESILKREYNIEINYGIEPSQGMAGIAKKRGMIVKIGMAEELLYEDEEFDTVIFNGTPSYIDNLGKALAEAYRVLKKGGNIVVADVPAESSYGLLYRMASYVKSYDDSYMKKTIPANPYPIEFVGAANWRTTEEKLELLEKTGFSNPACAQTLTRHPKYSNVEPEDPVEGYDRGDYVAVKAMKK